MSTDNDLENAKQHLAVAQAFLQRATNEQREQYILDGFQKMVDDAQHLVDQYTENKRRRDAAPHESSYTVYIELLPSVFVYTWTPADALAEAMILRHSSSASLVLVHSPETGRRMRYRNVVLQDALTKSFTYDDDDGQC